MAKKPRFPPTYLPLQPAEELQVVHKMLTARQRQLTHQLNAAYASLTGTLERPFSSEPGVADALPPDMPLPVELGAIMNGLHLQRDGSQELVVIDNEICEKVVALGKARRGSPIYETIATELEALLSARCGMWQEQMKMQQSLLPLLIEHGLAVPNTRTPTVQA